MGTRAAGACFVCPACRLRAASSACPRCGRDAVQVAPPDGYAALTEPWRPARAFLRGRSLLSPMAIPQLRALVWTSVVFGLAAAAAPVLGPALSKDGMPHGADLGIAPGVGVVSLALTVPFFARDLPTGTPVRLRVDATPRASRLVEARGTV